jgi:uncharacterized DUF497 family protein
VADIIWDTWQEGHIAHRHGVSAEDFEEAWHDPARVDLEERSHADHGPYTISIGAARGKALKMIWRWQHSSGAVWPITAFFPSRRKKHRKKGR